MAKETSKTDQIKSEPTKIIKSDPIKDGRNKGEVPRMRNPPPPPPPKNA